MVHPALLGHHGHGAGGRLQENGVPDKDPVETDPRGDPGQDEVKRLQDYGLVMRLMDGFIS